jgi:hypothetical protein
MMMAERKEVVSALVLRDKEREKDDSVNSNFDFEDNFEEDYDELEDATLSSDINMLKKMTTGNIFEIVKFGSEIISSEDKASMNAEIGEEKYE